MTNEDILKHLEERKAFNDNKGKEYKEKAEVSISEGLRGLALLRSNTSDAYVQEAFLYGKAIDAMKPLVNN